MASGGFGMFGCVVGGVWMDVERMIDVACFDAPQGCCSPVALMRGTRARSSEGLTGVMYSGGECRCDTSQGVNLYYLHTIFSGFEDS